LQTGKLRSLSFPLSLAGGSQGYGYFTGAHVLARAIDDITRAFGPELYEFMLLDAAIAGSFSKIRNRRTERPGARDPGCEVDSRAQENG
jgi:hypothetical protein